MILSCFIYLKYCLYAKNIPDIFGGQDHVMQRGQDQMWTQFNNSEQKS